MSRAHDDRINEIAGRQHGVVTRTQLLGAGLTARMIFRRLESRLLRPLHRGVYAVGPLVPPTAREMAAVLACGRGALASHDDAAALWQIAARPPVPAPVHVTVAGRDCGNRPGIVVHRVARLEADEAGNVDGIPVTAPARTLLDLAGTIGRRELEQALARAERLRLTTHAVLLSLIARYPRRPGTPRLKALLEADADPALTRSQAEEAFRELLRRARLPLPRFNVRIGPYEVDCLWAAERLVVEIDGFAYHTSRADFERDRRRDAYLAARRLRVVRMAARQIVREPEAVIALVAPLLISDPLG